MGGVLVYLRGAQRLTRRLCVLCCPLLLVSRSSCQELLVAINRWCRLKWRWSPRLWCACLRCVKLIPIIWGMILASPIAFIEIHRRRLHFLAWFPSISRAFPGPALCLAVHPKSKMAHLILLLRPRLILAWFPFTLSRLPAALCITVHDVNQANPIRRYLDALPYGLGVTTCPIQMNHVPDIHAQASYSRCQTPVYVETAYRTCLVGNQN